MATILYLNDTQVYPDGNQSIKLTRENPYFTHSESYTLDVVLPMDILDNRQFFQNIQRIDRTKRPPVGEGAASWRQERNEFPQYRK